MAIVVLVIVVTAAIVLVGLLQNRQDMRGMADHHRAMEALHKVAEPPADRHPERPVSPVLQPDRPRQPVRPLELSRLVPAPVLRRRPTPGRFRRPALVAALVLLVGAGVASITTFATSPHHGTSVATRRNRPAAAKPPAKPKPAANPAPTTPPPSTLQPASEQTTALQPTKADASTADYVVGQAPFSVVVTAGGPCWLQVRTAAGQVLFTGTLTPGQIQTFNGTDLRLRLGAAGNVTLQVNGSSLMVPVRTPDPYNVRVAQTV